MITIHHGQQQSDGRWCALVRVMSVGVRLERLSFLRQLDHYRLNTRQYAGDPHIEANHAQW
jgi:phosphodiesterase/alkaline phosphatase D-like protein